MSRSQLLAIGRAREGNSLDAAEARKQKPKKGIRRTCKAGFFSSGVIGTRTAGLGRFDWSSTHGQPTPSVSFDMSDKSADISRR